MNQETTFHYTGWFGLCPIYIDSLKDGATIIPRYNNTDWLLSLSEVIFGACFKIAGIMNPDFEPQWCFKGVRKLEQPVVIEFE